MKILRFSAMLFLYIFNEYKMQEILFIRILNNKKSVVKQIFENEYYVFLLLSLVKREITCSSMSIY